MSATAGGFVPDSGAGALLLEDLQSALQPGATIYAELLLLSQFSEPTLGHTAICRYGNKFGV